jgi:hypothetical protein
MTTAILSASQPTAASAHGGAAVKPAPATEERGAEQRFVIDGISYASYVQISDALPDRRRAQLLYRPDKPEAPAEGSSVTSTGKGASGSRPLLPSACASGLLFVCAGTRINRIRY